MPKCKNEQHGFSAVDAFMLDQIIETIQKNTGTEKLFYGMCEKCKRHIYQYAKETLVKKFDISKYKYGNNA